MATAHTDHDERQDDGLEPAGRNPRPQPWAALAQADYERIRKGRPALAAPLVLLWAGLLFEARRRQGCAFTLPTDQCAALAHRTQRHTYSLLRDLQDLGLVSVTTARVAGRFAPLQVTIHPAVDLFSRRKSVSDGKAHSRRKSTSDSKAATVGNGNGGFRVPNLKNTRSTVGAIAPHGSSPVENDSAHPSAPASRPVVTPPPPDEEPAVTSPPFVGFGLRKEVAK